jgi:hypothetical protein
VKVRFRPTEQIEFEIEGATQKDLFQALAQTNEVFGEPNCGNCGWENIYYNVRNSTAKKGKNAGKTFTYFEIVCRKCGHYLPIGQHNNDKGTLFPDRKLVDENGEYVIEDGKKVFDKTKKGWRKPTIGRQDHDDE